MAHQVNVFHRISTERNYQDKKWGTINERPHTVGEWLLIMQGELDEAIKAWQKNTEEPHSALDEVRQVAAVAVACMEEHGCPPRRPLDAQPAPSAGEGAIDE